MPFHTSEYDTYFLLGDPKMPPLWHWSAWHDLVPHLNPLIAAARGKPAVRSLQFDAPRTDVKFGRIGWNDAGHNKWTHGSPTNAEASTHWHFHSMEMWAPSWTQCQREGLSPDVFLSIKNEAAHAGTQTPLSFNPVILLAVFCDLAASEGPLLTSALAGLAKATRHRMSGHRRRPWAFPFGTIGYSNAIQHLAVVGMFKPGRRHDKPLDADLLQDQWDSVMVAPSTT